jgi:hypothetical protein
MASLDHSEDALTAPLCRIVTPVGMLGYGFDEGELNLGLELSVHTGAPTAIIMDSGSTDSGPEKLALGMMSQPRSNYYRDLRKLIQAIRKYRVPLLVGSAGGDGSDAHVKDFMNIITEILELPENEYDIYSVLLSHVISFTCTNNGIFHSQGQLN